MHPIVEKKTRLGLYLAAWLVLGSLLAILVQLASSDLQVWHSLLYVTPWVIVLGLVSLPVWYICRVFPLNREKGLQTIIVLLAAAGVTGGLWTLGAEGWSWILGQWEPLFLQRPAAELRLMYAMSVVLYLLAASVHYLIIAFEESRTVERRAFDMKWRAQESELRALRSQIDPHFLFNSLNSISALITHDPQAARRMLLMLSDFFRQSLKLGAEQMITLGQEFELCRQYLEIEQVRFGARLRVQVELVEDVRETPVPPLCLQPLAENAVRHGIAQLVDGGTVTMRAMRQGHLAVIDISNDKDDDHPSEPGAGIGLENVRQRLANHYGDRASLGASREPGTFSVRLILPVEIR